MVKKILVTGGAGFIGSHVVDELLEHGYEVRVLDSLSEQVHGDKRERPDYLSDDAELMVGDVRNKEDVKNALRGVDAVYHFAACVGVGQSMYQIERYTDVNNRGTAVLLECLIDQPIKKLVVASSVSIYGEGRYVDDGDNHHDDAKRTPEQLKNGDWEVYSMSGNELKPVPTPESKTPELSSIYALSKYDQEKMCLIAGRAYDIPTVALRFFNAYGSRQALSNPYTGVLAIFASRLMNGKPPLIFEDGKQQRDFVHVFDVAQACRLALEVPEAENEVFNVASGDCYTISQLAEHMASVLGRDDLKPEITGKYRVGDIRHCTGDIDKARRVLGYKPRINLEEGTRELVAWLNGQVATDHSTEATEELTARGLAL
ncbi:MAG: NAD-dependent epimerase/dehydratase family protein [Fimbriimonadaceae bacterium]